MAVLSYNAGRSINHKTAGLLLGPLAALLIMVNDPPQALSQQAWDVAAVASLMAVWWATEAIPLAATALLPLALLPLFGVDDVKGIAKTYSSSTVYLLLGGFIVALGLERWQLHRRIALSVLARVGGHPATLVGGVMLVTAATSMWVSNTASTLMMIPIALSMAGVIAPEPGQHTSHRNFTTVLLLAVAYSASIGGVGTLIGTPPNVLVAGYLQETHGMEIGFATWLLFGLPLVAVLLPAAWLLLTRVVFPISIPASNAARALIKDSLLELGTISKPEFRMLIIFVLVAAGWIFRPFINQLPGFAGLSDTGIAILGALALFVVPSGRGEFLMNWEWAKKLPWDVLLLYGGSISLAAMVSRTGLGLWLGDHLVQFTAWPELALIFIVVVVVLVLTELLNNSATVAAFLPVLGALAELRGMNPLMLALPSAMAASCAFMLPVATPPNTIVFGTGKVPLGSMVRGGAGINLLGIMLIPLVAYSMLLLLF